MFSIAKQQVDKGIKIITVCNNFITFAPTETQYAQSASSTSAAHGEVLYWEPLLLVIKGWALKPYTCTLSHNHVCYLYLFYTYAILTNQVTVFAGNNGSYIPRSAARAYCKRSHGRESEELALLV